MLRSLSSAFPPGSEVSPAYVRSVFARLWRIAEAACDLAYEAQASVHSLAQQHKQVAHASNEKSNKDSSTARPRPLSPERFGGFVRSQIAEASSIRQDYRIASQDNGNGVSYFRVSSLM